MCEHCYRAIAPSTVVMHIGNNRGWRDRVFGRLEASVHVHTYCYDSYVLGVAKRAIQRYIDYPPRMDGEDISIEALAVECFDVPDSGWCPESGLYIGNRQASEDETVKFATWLYANYP